MIVACGRGAPLLDDPAKQDGGSGLPAGAPIDATARCQAAIDARSSVGCDYWAVHMDGAFAAQNGCFAVFLANTSDAPARVEATFGGMTVDLAEHARLPRGSGRALAYEPLAPDGVPPGDVAILFLAGPPTTGTPRTTDFTTPTECPVAPAWSALTQVKGTGLGHAFHVKTSAPVVAYQMLPYGGGDAAVTGATLLLPANVWGTNYVATGAYDGLSGEGWAAPSMNIVAREDHTTVTILPNQKLEGGVRVPGGPANAPVSLVLGAGEHWQITQSADLAGSAIQSDKPVGLFAGTPCFAVPLGHPYCDHSEQQIPSVQQLGHDYVAAPYRSRSTKPEAPPWRVIGVADGTRLTWSRAVGGPATLGRGQVASFTTDEAFRVRAQDADHPFLLVGYMTGASTVEEGYGDPDFVRVVPRDQWLDRYVFFTDPTYPETNLVVVRGRGPNGFADVTLDCAGALGGWTAIDADHELARVDLVRHDFAPQGGCDNGRHEMRSAQPFALTVWGWGTPETSTYTSYVSYGYPAGQSARSLTTVTLPPDPR